MQQRSSDTELDFLSGLFYDVGRFHLNSSFPEEYALLFSAADDEFDWIEAEREQFGIDHTEVGATILKRWDFDEQLRAAARRHHDDPSALDGLPLRMAAVDELLPCPVERDEDGGIQLSTPSGPESACAELGLIGEELDTFCDRVRAVVDREIRFFVTAA